MLFFCFKVFSPSKELVIIKLIPLESEDYSSIVSAGIFSSLKILIISPGFRFSHLTSVFQASLSKSYQVIFYLFTIESCQYLFKSSTPSLIIDNDMTMTKGAIEAIGFKGDIIEIDYIIALIKKYILA